MTCESLNKKTEIKCKKNAKYEIHVPSLDKYRLFEAKLKVCTKHKKYFKDAFKDIKIKKL